MMYKNFRRFYTMWDIFKLKKQESLQEVFFSEQRE